jgi:hypothetical protein
MRDEEVIQREMNSAKEKADELEDEEPLNALMAMAVFRTLKWVSGEGEENIDDELLKMKDE